MEESSQSRKGDVYAEVAFNLPLAGTYTYRVPAALAGELSPGKRVEAPLGPRRMTGYCVSTSAEAPGIEARLKDIISIIDDDPLLDAHMLELTDWVRRRYFAGWGEALEAALPSGVRHKIGTRRVMRLAVPAEAALAEAQSWGKRASKRLAALRVLIENDAQLTTAELADRAGVSTATALSLIKVGLAEPAEVPAQRGRPRNDAPVRDYVREFELTREQAYAVAEVSASLDAKKYSPLLLFGVTGSGKTEVYLRAIEEVIRAGRQAIVLVPEISLTPQTVSRFRARFANIAVLHSHLAAGKRHREWRAIQSGQADVVIGARSAVFAPAARLGLIVIDEEHENTFKQDTSPRYHARDVAAKRAEMLRIPVILGSATPSLESFHASKTGRIRRIDLPNRVEGRPMPPVEIVDMRAERDTRRAYTILSRRLENHVRQALDAGNQAILFLNRRGFATYLTCRRCGWVGKCPACDITLTFHRSKDIVVCHYCGYTAEPPLDCPDCHYKGVKFYGTGTERVVEEVRGLFPEASVARMDSDTMTSRHAYTRALGDFRRGGTDILVGTQMIAKGLDFPNVTVVGVVSADVSLNLPDFRASERTFDLISQVAGRTGRGPKGGVVVVQTMTPNHFGIEAAAEHDYLKFAATEMAQRAELSYPPFGSLARIVMRSEDEARLEKTALKVADALKGAAAEGVTVLGPVPAVLSRIMGRYRYHLLVKAGSRGALEGTLENVRGMVKATGKVQGIIDVDPLSML